MAVKISIKPQEQMEIQLDLSVITINDVIRLMKLQEEGDEESLLEICKIATLVAGVNVLDLPILDAQEIIQAMMNASRGEEKN